VRRKPTKNHQEKKKNNNIDTSGEKRNAQTENKQAKKNPKHGSTERKQQGPFFL